MINKREKLNYLFQLIEKNSIREVSKFFDIYPEMREPQNKEMLRSINDWSPVYYCARNGYFDMLKFFFEDLNISEEISFLLLLSVHSGSLPVINYLFNKNKSPMVDLVMPLYSSCNLGKINVGIYIMLRGSMVLDDDSFCPKDNKEEKWFICHNMSYEFKDNKYYYYDKNGGLLYEETQEESEAPATVRKITSERKLLVLSSSATRMHEKKTITSISRQFYFDFINELCGARLRQKGFQKITEEEAKNSVKEGEQKDEKRLEKKEEPFTGTCHTNFRNIFSIIDKSEVLKPIFQKYRECKYKNRN